MKLYAGFFTHVVSIVILLTCIFSCKRGNESLILIDGSSTVYPISEAVAEEFLKKYPGASIAIGESGTGGGFTKFCRGESDINNASRPITKEEIQECRREGIKFIEMPIAYDGLAVVVHPSNTWAKYLTVKELKKIWQPSSQGKLLRWSQVREDFPDKEIHLYGAGVSSGTYDYFTEAIVGTRRASRGDYTASEDDNVLVQGISTDPLALGYFGLAYYSQNSTHLKAVAINDGNEDNGKGAILPTYENVRSGAYQPLTRPEFIYIRNASAKKEIVQQFIRFYIKNASLLVKEAGYVPLSEKTYGLVQKRFTRMQMGSLFLGKPLVGVNLEDFLIQPKP